MPWLHLTRLTEASPEKCPNWEKGGKEAKVVLKLDQRKRGSYKKWVLFPCGKALPGDRLPEAEALPQIGPVVN